jgi:hypothetical protein
VTRVTAKPTIFPGSALVKGILSTRVTPSHRMETVGAWRRTLGREGPAKRRDRQRLLGCSRSNTTAEGTKDPGKNYWPGAVQLERLDLHVSQVREPGIFYLSRVSSTEAWPFAAGAECCESRPR